MKNKFYITTAIDYVNARPHIGHALEKVQADVLARYFRDVLEKETFFLTGTDENSLKNVEGACKAGKKVEDFVLENADIFKDLGKLLNLSFDDFIRTTEKRHFEGASKLWKLFKPEDIYKKYYKGLYCVGCEEFKTEKDLVDGKCPDHAKEPEIVEEENYFFKLSNYQKQLEEIIEKGKLEIIPEFRKNEVLSFIRQGLEDFSISRSKERAKNWGVPVPGDDSQIMYVWVDALSNYINGLDFATDGELYKKFWADENSEKIHVIGKGILRFHAIYWPAMLLSAGIALPTKIFCHEYLTINGKKISKTLGNIINPEEIINKFGLEGGRYILLSSLPYHNDGDVTWEGMVEKYNSELANGLGNLLSRVVKLYPQSNFEIDKLEIEEVNLIADTELKALENFNIEQPLNYLSGLIREDNKYIEENKPWELAKNDSDKFNVVMKKLVLDLYQISRILVPYLPETSDKIKKALETKNVEPLFQRIK
jgi:methionyl-tRNA synthetase